jgi:hypothetical protein
MLIILFYHGGRNRIREEKRLITEGQKRDAELIGRKK